VSVLHEVLELNSASGRIDGEFTGEEQIRLQELWNYFDLSGEAPGPAGCYICRLLDYGRNFIAFERGIIMHIYCGK
jgi:hypothetical protein